MDDSNIFDSEPGGAASSNAYLRECYKALNIPVSTKNSWDPTQLPIITGNEGGMLDRTLGLSREKWTDFEHRIGPACTSREPLTIDFLLKAAGSLMHLTELFPYLKPSFIPMSRWLGECNQICHANKRRWKRIKEETATIPQPLQKLIGLGWSRAKVDRTVNVRDLLRTEVDADIVLATDACGMSDELATDQHPAGLGAVVHKCRGGAIAAGTRAMELLPRDHPIATKPIAWLELFTSVLWILQTCQRGWLCVIYTDNTNAEHWMRKYKAKPAYIGLMMRLANFCRVKKVTLIIKRSDTEHILADPLSRTYEDYEADWRARAKEWKVPHDGPIVSFLWRDLWDQVREIEEEYGRFSIFLSRPGEVSWRGE